MGENRLVLLQGPPGTGKTSLCRGLAHKLAIQMSDHYAQGYLVEVNAHSLFSKWFSESGKMVMHMFARIRELLEKQLGEGSVQDVRFHTGTGAPPV